jgi:hypothetical protein
VKWCLPPFFKRDTRAFDSEQILTEAIPLAKLIGLIAALALIPAGIAFTFGTFPQALLLVTQFILPVGTGIVLLYIIARGIQLAEK